MCLLAANLIWIILVIQKRRESYHVRTPFESVWVGNFYFRRHTKKEKRRGRRKVSNGQKEDWGVREVQKERRKTDTTQPLVQSCRIIKCDIRTLLKLTKKFYILRLLGQRAQ